jgi:hypothetical protein
VTASSSPCARYSQSPGCAESVFRGKSHSFLQDRAKEMVAEGGLLGEPCRRDRDHREGRARRDVPDGVGELGRCVELPIRAVGHEAEIHVANNRPYRVSRRMGEPFGQPAQRSTQNPHCRILFTDMTRQLDRSWGRPADPDPLLRGVNHFNRAANAPEGSNEAYLDGQVGWVPFHKFRSQPRLRLPSTVGVFEYHFHGGQEEVAVR